MMDRVRGWASRWSLVLPVAALVVLAGTWGRKPPGAVLAAVHHAEVVAHRVGEPLGSLVLAVAVTVIEVALIVTLMADGSEKNSTLARDTVFAAAMITCNGIVGVCLLIGSLRHRVAVFDSEGTGAAALSRPRTRPDEGLPERNLPRRGRNGDQLPSVTWGLHVLRRQVPWGRRNLGYCRARTAARERTGISM